eukprot:4254196-Pyramimonas_sp.AAC.1
MPAFRGIALIPALYRVWAKCRQPARAWEASAILLDMNRTARLKKLSSCRPWSRNPRLHEARPPIQLAF